jgi:hypothetical protein
VLWTRTCRTRFVVPDSPVPEMGLWKRAPVRTSGNPSLELPSSNRCLGRTGKGGPETGRLGRRRTRHRRGQHRSLGKGRGSGSCGGPNLLMRATDGCADGPRGNHPFRVTSRPGVRAISEPFHAQHSGAHAATHTRNRVPINVIEPGSSGEEPTNSAFTPLLSPSPPRSVPNGFRSLYPNPAKSVEHRRFGHPSKNGFLRVPSRGIEPPTY